MLERALILDARSTDAKFVSRLFNRLEVATECDGVLHAEIIRQRFEECPISMEDGVQLLRLDCCTDTIDGPMHVMCAQCWSLLRSDPKRCPTCDKVAMPAGHTLLT